MIPATRYCDGEGSVIYTCNGDALSFEYPSSTPVAYGNITANVNGSMTYFSSMQPNYPQLLEYSAQNRTVWVSNFYSTSAAYVSADMCTLPLFRTSPTRWWACTAARGRSRARTRRPFCCRTATST
jgi:hypothetical protein